MVTVSTRLKSAASRTARHKKKYWRKGTDVSAFDKVIHDKTYGTIADKPDKDLFTIDRTPSSEVKKYTKRQQAALDKISRSVREPQKLPLPSPKCPSLKKQPKLKQPVVRVEKTTPKSAAPGYDLWETDFEPKLNLEYEEAGEHMLRYTKQKLPNKPSTARFKPSLLDAVAKPDAGASYNPKAEDYEKYVMKIAQDETKLMQEEERIERARKPKHESVVTYAEKSLEETEGLVIDPRYNANDEEEESDVKEEGEEPMETGEKITISHLKRKTKKQKLNAAKEKKLLREQKKRKEIEKKQHDMTTRQKLGGGEFKDEEEPRENNHFALETQNEEAEVERSEREETFFASRKSERKSRRSNMTAKSINKELVQKEQEVAEKAAKRKKEKFLKKMTTRQKLGGGEFKDEEEPFLLQEELSDSLRKLKPQGHVLNDRLASLQRRNMLPIGGPRNKNKLKTKLKRKFVEKRLVAEVTKGSRVM
ncbi:Nop53 protein [Oesophagostomum dentatum]|uniref:Ribosome biogenesis protein NOP53 n=1 Tax=Oesophagostomum dentatum TaxID=61180 RepID=A0A0B1T435_OESDE|nr:Nop53 protein [Oesophagostomum dentatum]